MKRKAQEEMVGFVLIIVLVMIIVLVFLGFSINKNDEKSVESYEVTSFVSSLKQYTTTCSISNAYDYRNIEQLIKDCSGSKSCYDSSDTCEVLEEDLEEIMKASWNPNDRGGLKGYSLSISDEDDMIFNMSYGNITKSYIAPIDKGNDDIVIDIRIYQ